MQSETLAKCVQKFERIAQIIDCNLYHQREKVEDAKSIAMAMVDELRRAEAALSAAEPVMYVSERQLASCVGTYVPSRKTAEGLFQLALYRAPPAPSVAVKALRQAASDFMHLFIQDGHLTVQGLEDTDLIPAYEKLSAALSAQVQDESEIVDCLLAGKPFVFDPATNFCHADDGGTPEHGIKYVPAEQVQDVAGWQPIETAPKDGTPVILWTVWVGDEISPDPFSEVQIGYWDHGNDLPESHDFSRRPEWVVQRIGEPTHWMPLPAAPAKQEGDHD